MAWLLRQGHGLLLLLGSRRPTRARPVDAATALGSQRSVELVRTDGAFDGSGQG